MALPDPSGQVSAMEELGRFLIFCQPGNQGRRAHREDQQDAQQGDGEHRQHQPRKPSAGRNWWLTAVALT